MLRADNHTTFMYRVSKSGSLNLLESSGPAQACNRIALYVLFGRISRKESSAHGHQSFKIK